VLRGQLRKPFGYVTEDLASEAKATLDQRAQDEPDQNSSFHFLSLLFWGFRVLETYFSKTGLFKRGESRADE
jgi:hypothetical protein